MSANYDLERRIADHYAAETPPRAPDWVLERILASVDTTPQRRTLLSRSWRFPTMTSFTKLAVGTMAIVILAGVGLTALRQPAVGPGAKLGIFAPVAGRILSGLWAIDPIAVDPSAPSRSTPLRLGPEEFLPLGWSSDGTKLLFMRKDPTDQMFPAATHLFILHTDGTETQLNRDAVDMSGATIAPDGSRVVYAAADPDASRFIPPKLFVIDAEGGQPVRIAEAGQSPTFSPDGSQIAYLVNESGPETQIWVADEDGTDAHQILADDPALAGVSDLAWSPAGDRIAIGNSLEGNVAIYTVAPDGSDFTKVISGGMNPYWSPDGSQIAFMIPYDAPLGGGSPGLAIAASDGSNVREFGFGASGPWHPGTAVEDAPPPVETPTPAETPTLTLSPSPAADVISDPVFGGGLHLAVASQAYGPGAPPSESP